MYSKVSVFNCLKEEVKLENPRPTSKIQHRGLIASLKKKERKLKKQKHKPRLVVKMEYHDYIKSKFWRRRRKRYFLKFGKQCAVCGSSSKVGLHHLSYENLCNEPDSDLIALCWLHHSKYHDENGVERVSREKTIQYVIEEQEATELQEIIKHL